MLNYLDYIGWIVRNGALKCLLILLTTCNIFTGFGTSNDKLMQGVLHAAGALLPDPPSFCSAEDYRSENFFDGNSVDKPTDGAAPRWHLGYAQGRLTPPDFGEKAYYAGGTFYPADFMFRQHTDLSIALDMKYSDIYVRAAALHDGTGRGISVIAVVDCIGLSNADVRTIRALVLEKAAGAFTFSDITVAATHDHSSIDTQGLWTDTLKKGTHNFLSGLFRRNRSGAEQGADEAYMAFLCETVSDTILRACERMKSGTMTYAEKDGLETLLSFKNRTNLQSIIGEMYRFVFTPDDPSERPTMILNFSAHPYFTAVPETTETGKHGDGLSGDFVYYWEQIIRQAGYNFLFFNGSVAGIYPYAFGCVNRNFDIFENRDAAMQVYGTLLGKIALSMTRTQDEITADPLLVNPEAEAEERRLFENSLEELLAEYIEYGIEIPADAMPSFYCWYENWQPVQETELTPCLDTEMLEIRFRVTNPLIRLVGKLGLVNYRIVRDKRIYDLISETGIIRFGTGDEAVTLVLSPGEMFQEMEAGGPMMTAEGSCRKTDFAYPPIRGMFGGKTIVFGLANDAIGYIIPDNDYMMCWDYQAHYHEYLSLGETTASTLFAALQTLAEAQRI